MWKETKAPFHETGELVRAPLTILEAMNRLKWAAAIGCFREKTYSIQPGRGQPGLWAMLDHPCNGLDIWYGIKPEEQTTARGQGYRAARLAIISIQKQRLQEITPADCIAEGIQDSWLDPFKRYWTRKPNSVLITDFAQLWDSLHKEVGHRWIDNPYVWALTYELVLI